MTVSALMYNSGPSWGEHAPRLREVTHNPVGEQVYATIESAILSGRLPGGTHLRVRQLAEMVGTSAMPVRDAISRLEEVNLAIREPNRGAFVREFTFAEVVDIYSVRMLIEVAAARTGATSITSRGIVLMQEAVQDMTAAVADGRIADD